MGRDHDRNREAGARADGRLQIGRHDPYPQGRRHGHLGRHAFTRRRDLSHLFHDETRDRRRHDDAGRRGIVRSRRSSREIHSRLRRNTGLSIRRDRRFRNRTAADTVHDPPPSDAHRRSDLCQPENRTGRHALPQQQGRFFRRPRRLCRGGRYRRRAAADFSPQGALALQHFARHHGAPDRSDFGADLRPVTAGPNFRAPENAGYRVSNSRRKPSPAGGDLRLRQRAPAQGHQRLLRGPLPARWDTPLRRRRPGFHSGGLSSLRADAFEPRRIGRCAHPASGNGGPHAATTSPAICRQWAPCRTAATAWPGSVSG